ncbi:MAG: V-type ATP synthase subunit E [Treponema sp.]|jgi:V/A-type H+-transporting ATPase subunit E|nr:V-type ATP synthase subunit E [Treponema sp.]
MEIQVQELIDKIKKDGISAASEEASRIKTEAGAEAQRVLETAKREAEEIVRNGKQEAERSEKAGVAALEQASRNLVLVFKDEIQALLNRLINEHVSAQYNEDALKNVLPELLKSWAEKGSDNLTVILPESELSKIQSFFSEKMTGELWKGIELKSSRKLTSGFHISNREGSVYYDFSAEAVATLLSAYLSPKLAEILKNSSKGI